MSKKETINALKRVFDEHKVKRTNYPDDFFEDLIQAVNNPQIESKIIQAKVKQKSHIPTIRNVKMELMINIEGICNEMKGRTKRSRYRFGIDVINLPLQVFLSEAKILIRNREFQKSDIIIFSDDTRFRLGNRGFAVTRDEIISNSNGLFKVLRFMEMDQKAEFVTGLKKDVIRFHMEEHNYDIKIKKNMPYTSIVMEVLDLLFEYAQIIKEEQKK